MNALALKLTNDAGLVVLPEQEAGPGQLKVQIIYTAVAGSAPGLNEHFSMALDDSDPLSGDPGPLVPGHGLSGRVVSCGEGVDIFPLGALVAVRPRSWDGTCAAGDYVVVDAGAAFMIPENLGPQVAAMVASTALAWHAVRVSGVKAGSTALITGAGPIGLALLLCLKARGIDRIIVSEVCSSRRTLASTLGADVLDPRVTDVLAYVRGYTSRIGVDVAFDASGIGQSTYDAAFGALRNGGTSVVVAQCHEPISVDLNSFLRTEKHVVGSFASTERDFRDVADAINSGSLDLRPLISNEVQ